MYTHHILLILHLVAATIWVGGHLVLAIGFLPKALKHNDFSYIANFEKTYEPIGMPSLLVLVITGIILAYDYGATFSTWLFFNRKRSFAKTSLFAYFCVFCYISTDTRTTSAAQGQYEKTARNGGTHHLCNPYRSYNGRIG